jgi:hypothetical protein
MPPVTSPTRTTVARTVIAASTSLASAVPPAFSERGHRGSDRGGDDGNHPGGTDDEADPQASPAPRSVTESAEKAAETNHHPQRHREEQGRENTTEDRPPDWIAMHATARRATFQAAAPPAFLDCPQGRRVESRNRPQRFRPAAVVALNRRLIQRGDSSISRDRR